MANAYHDGNGTHTLLCVQDNGSTLINIEASPTIHSLNVSDGTTGSDNGPANSFHDGGHVPIFMATSSADGKTPVAIYADSSGNLLVDSM